MPLRRRSTASFFAVFAFLIFAAFQNCGPATLSVGKSSPADSGSAPSGSTDAPVVTPTPSPTPTPAPTGPIAIQSCTASGALSGYPCTSSYDGNPSTFWNSGANTAWIEYDFGSVQTLSKFSLAISQSPSGNTVHNVYYSTTSGQGKMLTTFSQFSDDNSVFNYTGPSVQARFIKIETTTNPSWTAWKEVQFIH